MLKKHNSPNNAGVDLEGGGGIKSPTLKPNETLYDTLTWLQNAGNPISEELNFKNFPARKMAPDPPYWLWQSTSQSPFSKFLCPPQQ